MLGALAAKVRLLKEQLMMKFSMEKQKISRTIRILEKCLRNATILADESCEQVNAYKGQLKEYLINIYIEYLNLLIVLKAEKASIQVHNMKQRQEEVIQMKQFYL